MDEETPVANWMTRAPVTVQVEQTLSEARRVMTEGGFHHVPVLCGAKLVGMLSSADMLRVSSGCEAVPLQRMGGGDQPLGISSLMSRELVVLDPEATVRRAVELLACGRFHALPVVGARGELMGLVTSTDVIRHLWSG
jgi:CBS domain-containing protein